jgi:hypothetical protein
MRPSKWPILKCPSLAGFHCPLTVEKLVRATKSRIDFISDHDFAGVCVKLELSCGPKSKPKGEH